jgi:hypothetical protein
MNGNPCDTSRANRGGVVCGITAKRVSVFGISVLALFGCSSSPADVAPPRVGDSGAVDAAIEAGLLDSAAGAPESSPPVDGASLCDKENFIFCDGFEEGLTRWTGISASEGSPSADGIHVYRGKKALHAYVDPISANGATQYAYAQWYRPQPLPSQFFTRFFAYVPSPMAPSPAGLINIMQNGGAYGGIELLLAPTAALSVKTYNTGSDQAWQSATTSTLGDWVCFEIEIDVEAQTVHVYMNDAEVADLMMADLALPELGLVGVGLGYYEAKVQASEDAWIDEVAVNGTRIGCTH